MKLLSAFVVFFLATMAFQVSAQSKETSTPGDKNFPTTLQPVNPVKYYGPKKQKKVKKRAAQITYEAQNEYNERMEKTWREREKREKSLEAGEGIDRMKSPYFGHKKAPKIRPIEKRKYCKICGIRH